MLAIVKTRASQPRIVTLLLAEHLSTGSMPCDELAQLSFVSTLDVQTVQLSMTV